MFERNNFHFRTHSGTHSVQALLQYYRNKPIYYEEFHLRVELPGYFNCVLKANCVGYKVVNRRELLLGVKFSPRSLSNSRALGTSIVWPRLYDTSTESLQWSNSLEVLTKFSQWLLKDPQRPCRLIVYIMAFGDNKITKSPEPPGT